MKKILLLLTITTAIFIIYITTRDQKVYYLALGDDITTLGIKEGTGFPNYVNKYLEYYDKSEIFVKEYAEESYRITDLITDINNNKKTIIANRENTIKNALIKADLVTLSVGMNDLTSKINSQTLTDKANYQNLYDSADEISKDLEELLLLIKNLCKEDIYLIGLYYPYQIKNQSLNNVFSYLNKRFKEVAAAYQVHYIDIYDIFSENEVYRSDLTIYPSEKGLEEIGSQVIVTINNASLKNS
ncbi:MAG: SGNH/GDSL hydrolase family protein [Firmicutes bacterium]|nr:SGNH/GDSL hydrolase family protein [Bacillota bacterium]